MPSITKETDSGINQLIAGAGAGCLTAIATCPLDVLKTRLQSAQFDYRHTGIAGSLKLIWKQEGLTGLYRGLSPTMLGQIPTWTIFFGTYDYYKRKSGSLLGQAPNELWPTVLGSMMAGFTNNLVTNPLWVVKTRMMTLNNPTELSGRPTEIAGAAKNLQADGNGYRTTRQAFRTIWRNDGLWGFYKGFAASLVGVGHVAIQFPLYEYLKRRLLPSNDPTEQSFTSLLLASTLSKLVASMATYPHEVLRTRLHNESTPPVKYKGLISSVRIIAQEEGWMGFYRGLGTNLIRTIPASAVTLLSYEMIFKLLNR